MFSSFQTPRECPETRHPDGPLAIELKSLELFVLDSVQLFGFPLRCLAAKKPCSPLRSHSRTCYSLTTVHQGCKGGRQSALRRQPARSVATPRRHRHCPWTTFEFCFLRCPFNFQTVVVVQLLSCVRLLRPSILLELDGRHQRLNGHKFEHTLEHREGQGSLASCSPWGHKESDTT